LYWDFALLVVVGFMIVTATAIEAVLPYKQTDAAAPELSRRLGVPEDRVRRDLSEVLSDRLSGGESRWALLRAMPLCIVGALIAIRTVYDWRTGRATDSGHSVDGA
jgi:hypothetical protein